MHSLLLSLALLGPPPDDVLVILLDDVGKDLLSVYGGPQPASTPNLDLLAAGGRVYDRAYANPLCAPSRACMMTGRYSFRTGFGTTPGPFDPYVLDAGESCLPEFVDPGDGTAFLYLNKWHLVHSDGATSTDRHPFDACAFDEFFGHLANIGSEAGLPGTDHYYWRAVEMNEEGPEVVVLDGYAAGDFSETFWATSICKQQLVTRLNGLPPAQRAITVWAPVAPHAPFQAPPPTLVSPQTAATVLPPPALAPEGGERPYGLAMLEALDSVIGELLAELDPARLARTTIFVVGDNGTSKKVLHPSLDPDRAKGSLYELGIGVPLIVSGPAVASPGTRDDALIHIVDLPATISELVGAPYGGGGDSVSFHATYANDQPGTRTTVFSERFDPNGLSPEATIRAMVGPRYKLICYEDRLASVEELYDLELDPDETTDLLLGALTVDQRAAYVALRVELANLLGRPASFCDATDGALDACPCGNAGAPASGCDLQQGTGGVRLRLTEQRTAPLQRATMVGTGFPVTGSTPAAIVIRAPALDPASPVVFGDGVRCVGVPLVRLGATLATGGVSTHTFAHGPMAPPGSNYYQLWFRNAPVMFCDPAAAFNLSNGQVLVW